MGVLTKEYVYKVHDDATYKGTFRDVQSEFSYYQAINTAGVQLEVILGNAFPDTGADVAADFMVDESSNNFVDETGNLLITESTYTFQNIPIALGNRLTVDMIDDNNPDGITVFDGIITSWKADYRDNSVTLKALSYGVFLDESVIKSGAELQILNDEAAAIDTYFIFSGSDPGGYRKLAQEITAGSAYELGTVSANLSFFGTDSTDRRATLELYAGTLSVPGELLASITIDLENLLSSPSAAFDENNFEWVDFTFSTPIALTSSSVYHFVLSSSFVQTVDGRPYQFGARYSSMDNYAGGDMWYYDVDSDAWVELTGADLFFRLYSTSGSVVAAYTNADPSDILRDILDDYASQGGLISYTSETIDDTEKSVNHEFNLNTFYEGIRVLYEFAGGGFYWYGDPATNLLYFKLSNNNADHTLVLKRHIEAIELEQNLDQVVNAIYFSGGDDGSGVNVFRYNTNSSSIGSYGQWLERISNNRVHNDADADLISQSEISRRSSPAFIGRVTVLDQQYEIETLRIGQIVEFRGFNNLIDSLLLQIIGRTIYADRVELELGTIQERNSKYLDDVNRRLIALETVDNPDIPT